MKSKHISRTGNYRLSKAIQEGEQIARERRVQELQKQERPKAQTLTERLKEMNREMQATGKFGNTENTTARQTVTE